MHIHPGDDRSKAALGGSVGDRHAQTERHARQRLAAREIDHDTLAARCRIDRLARLLGDDRRLTGTNVVGVEAKDGMTIPLLNRHNSVCRG